MPRVASAVSARGPCLAAFVARLACALGEAHAFSESAESPAAPSPQPACGAYGGASCDAVLMSVVLTESTGAFAVKCLVAVALGAVIGAQREFSPYLGMFLARARHTAVAPVRRAGLRTHVLVALGACLFTEASWSAFAVPVPAQVASGPFVAGTFNYDTSRVAAQVVSGIGFLGAGTIWRSSFGSGDAKTFSGARDEVYGLTTAASLWTTAAVGMHCGGANQKDAYFAGPVFATALVVITLQALVHVELAAHARAFTRTTARVNARVVLEIDQTGQSSPCGDARDALADDAHREPPLGLERRPSAGGARFRPGDALRGVVAAVERRETLRVASVGASVDMVEPRRRSVDEEDGASNRTPRAGSPSGLRAKVRVSLVAVVPASGGSTDLLDALVSCEGVTEAHVDACGPKRVETRTRESLRRDATNAAEDAEHERSAPLLPP